MNFLLTCISTKHSLLKKHWSNNKQVEQKIQCPVTTLGSIQKPKEDQGGLLCLLNDYLHDRWFLVDGKNSRIDLRLGITGEKTAARFDLNPEWRLYEVLPLAS